jgi:hypothetical protein
MPRRFLEEYYSDEELAKMVRKLNALTSRWSPWQRTQARKEHEDLFEETIQPNEVYFKRRVGSAWGDDIKLSRLSMERLLFVLFDANPSLEKLAEQIGKERLERLREEHERCSPVARLFREKDG